MWGVKKRGRALSDKRYTAIAQRWCLFPNQ